jgi:FAD:protein FMN transferase
MQITDATRIIPKVYRKVLKLMGNRFEISIVATDAFWAHDCIEEAVKEISRIERLLTTFDEDSQTNLINRNAGIAPVKVDDEVFELIRRSKKISGVTQGAFDITYGSIDKRLWNFDKNMTELPKPELAKQLVRLSITKMSYWTKKDALCFSKKKE